MPIGPVEYVIIEFPGNHFRGQIVPAIGLGRSGRNDLSEHVKEIRRASFEA